MDEQTKGGTRIFCPHCRVIQVCAVVPTTECGIPRGQRVRRTDHKDVQWFRRGRQCQVCKGYFLTAEVSEKFLEELVELRNALKAAREKATSSTEKAQSVIEAMTFLLANLHDIASRKTTQEVEKEKSSERLREFKKRYFKRPLDDKG